MILPLLVKGEVFGSVSMKKVKKSKVVLSKVKFKVEFKVEFKLSVIFWENKNVRRNAVAKKGNVKSSLLNFIEINKPRIIVAYKLAEDHQPSETDEPSKEAGASERTKRENIVGLKKCLIFARITIFERIAMTAAATGT